MANCRYKLIRTVLAFCSVAFLAGCTRQEQEVTDVTGLISFNISDVSTKSVEYASDGGAIRYRTKFDDAELYLHTSIKHGIADCKDVPGTRAGEITTDELKEHGFGVYAFIMNNPKDGQAYDASYAEEFMMEQPVTAEGKGTAWKYDPVKYWPAGSYLLRFHAYAPYGAEGLTTSADGNVPILGYTVPADAAKQSDLLAVTLEPRDETDKNVVEFLFKHVCTAIRFSVGTIDGTIHSISVKNVFNSGAFDMSDEVWTLDPATGDFILSLDYAIPDNAGNGNSITSGQQTLMMLPQILPADAQLEVSFSEGTYGITRTLTADIGGKEWPMGKTVNYTISTEKLKGTPVFSVTGPEDFTYEGGEQEYSIVSYLDAYDGIDYAVDWKAEFVRQTQDGTYEVISEGDSDYPGEWLTISHKGKDTDCYIVEVKHQELKTENIHDMALSNAVSANSVYSQYNLSNSSGAEKIENTANCYIVNGPGTYCIPLVYGNAIKNGATNKSSYAPGVNASGYLKSYLNHAGKAITDPYIANNGIVPDNAVMIWQDAENLVSDVRLVKGNTADSHRIVFDVLQPSIKQGNAIIALRNSGNVIVWSWHIWVTDYVPGLEAEILTKYNPILPQRDAKVYSYNNSYKYTFMGLPLGWCYDIPEYYPENRALVRFWQNGNDTPQIIEVNQLSHTVFHGGNAPYYQWGRKDPMLPSDGKGSDDGPYNRTLDKLFYATDYPFVINEDNKKVSLATAIQNPNVFYVISGTSNDWCSTHYENLWNTVKTGTLHFPNSTKTVYDPSPAGYVLPPNGAISGFTRDGETQESVNSHFGDINTCYISNDEFSMYKGWMFYCRGMNGKTTHDPSGGLLFFPALGARANTHGGVSSLHYYVYYWSSTHAGQDSAGYLRANSTSVATKATNDRANGFSVRPVRE